MHVDASAALGVRATERHLQRGEVDDVRHPIVVESAPHRFEVGHVALDERDPSALVLRQREPKACVIRAEVVADRLLPQLDERLQRPGA
jgi:hypothetical protein